MQFVFGEVRVQAFQLFDKDRVFITQLQIRNISDAFFAGVALANVFKKVITAKCRYPAADLFGGKAFFLFDDFQPLQFFVAPLYFFLERRYPPFVLFCRSGMQGDLLLQTADRFAAPPL